MATADLITDFLSNDMSPERERQFLLSVAASDALRLELKSHLMVDRILVDRVQTARVPETVRSTIFAAAGIAAGQALTADAAAKPVPSVDRAPTPRASFFSRLGGRVTLAATACALFGAGYLVGNGSDVLRASDTQPATSVSMPGSASVAPRVAEEPTLFAPQTGLDAQRTETDESATRARAIERAVTSSPRPAARTPESTSPTNAAPSAPSSSASGTTSAEGPAASNEPARDPRASRARNGAAPIGVQGTIEKPTEEMRREAEKSSPLGAGGD